MDLQKLYNEGKFKPGFSKVADQAIANLLEKLDKNNFSNSDFKGKWGEFLKILITEWPNISPYNIVQLETPLLNQQLMQENLIIARFAAELLPNSAECHCFLGHAYRNVGDHASAVKCYAFAYEITKTKIAKLSKLSTSDLHDFACSYLLYLADAELSLKNSANALTHAFVANTMIKELSPPSIHLKRLYDTLYHIYQDMGLVKLAEDYKLLNEKTTR